MLGITQSNKSDPQAIGDGLEHDSTSMAAVIASIDRSVDQLRAGNISAGQFRRLAVDRRRSEVQAWVQISHAARVRGAW